MSDPGAPDLLRFWFEVCQPAQWFRKDPAFDQQVRERFGELSQRALAGELQPWADQPGSALALVLLLDQLPRQLRRDQPGAFAGRHRDVIAHFGRFPHRNGALGRSSSAEELAFLEQPGSRF
ncbi:DUF924 family protein [Synechococcus sp. RedBA-s]|uniref:DUF924 family protein n=1 Tax=Synechococcus sp. RedBA-s TaxID=2823741 RepID=UPI0020CBD75F|nr:DUF924 family protein [Synechococcus sp. RedBA-s]MCP9799790.1 DUF924 family protein [Synechococcus sp. RedBA-s]